MTAPVLLPTRTPEEAQVRYNRVEREIDAIDATDESDLSAHNVDYLSAASIALGVAEIIRTYRPIAVELPGVQVRYLDNLDDYASALWYLAITNFSGPAASKEAEARVTSLRAKLLLWAQPLAASGFFSQADVDKIKEGAGLKDAAGDCVALATLFSTSWDTVKNMCGVTEEELAEAKLVGTAVFTAASRRENEVVMSLPQAALRLRKAWTLLDRAYLQCRKVVTYARYEKGDYDVIAPSLRRTTGRRSSSDNTPETPASPAPSAATPTTTTGGGLGGNSSPFITR